MKELDLVQGSQEWLDTRAKRFTASEAPAMKGESKYVKRSDLLKQKATGIAPEVSEMLQSIFDKGHAAEDDARPIAETIIGEELYPTTAVCDEDVFLASFDGITMLGDIIWEHKLFNKDLVASIKIGDLAPTYYWQLEQQLMISGAEKALFMCSDGTEQNMIYMWYFPVTGRRQQLIDGWAQFADDLSNYELPETVVEPIGAEMEDLPVLHIDIEGKVLSSNLDSFEAKAMAIIDGINTNLQTDQDFADAEKAVKFCTKAEKILKDKKERVLGQAADIDAITKTIDRIGASTRETRLHLAKLIKTEKDNKRANLVLSSKQAFQEHINSLQNNLNGVALPLLSTDFATAIKGKKTISSMQDAVDSELARAKIEANAIAETMRANLASLEELATAHKFLFSDHAVLILKNNDDLVNLIKARISEHEEEEKERLEAQRIKLEKEAAEKAEADRETIRQEEAAKLKAEQDAELAKATAEQPIAIAEEIPQVQATASITIPGRTRPFVIPTQAKATLSPQQKINFHDFLEANWDGYEAALIQFNNQKAA